MDDILSILYDEDKPYYDRDHIERISRAIEINNPKFDPLANNEICTELSQASHDLLFVLLIMFTENTPYVNSLGLADDAILLTNRFNIYLRCIWKIYEQEVNFIADIDKYRFRFVEHYSEHANKYFNFSLYNSLNEIPFTSFRPEEIEDVTSSTEPEDKNIFLDIITLFSRFLEDFDNIRELAYEINKINSSEYNYVPELTGFHHTNFIHYNHCYGYRNIPIPTISNTIDKMKNYLVIMQKFKASKNKFNFCLRYHKSMKSLPVYLKGMVVAHSSRENMFFLYNVSSFIQNIKDIATINDFYKRFYIISHYLWTLLNCKLVDDDEIFYGYQFLYKYLDGCENQKFVLQKRDEINGKLQKCDTKKLKTPNSGILLTKNLFSYL